MPNYRIQKKSKMKLNSLQSLQRQRLFNIRVSFESTFVEGQNNVTEAVFHSSSVLEDFVNLKRVNSTKQTVISQYLVKL